MKRMMIIVFVTIACLLVFTTVGIAEERYCYINTEGDIVGNDTWDYAYPIKEGMGRVFLGALDDTVGWPHQGRFGFVDLNGNIVVDTIWNYAEDYNEGLALVFNGSVGEYFASPEVGDYYFIDKSGAVVIQDLPYEKVKSFNGGMSLVVKNGKYGFIDKSGDLVVDTTFDYAYPFSDGLALVYNGRLSKYGLPESGDYSFIDTKGNVAFKNDWESVDSFSSGVARISINGKYGYINTSGKIVVKPEWDWADFEATEGRACVFIGSLTKYNSPDKGRYGYIDFSGNTISKPQWEATKSVSFRFDNGFAPIRRNSLFGFLNLDGSVVVEPRWDFVKQFSEGMAVVFAGKYDMFPGDGKYGYVDTSGELAIRLQWEGAESFSNGLAAVKKNGKWGYINNKGEMIIEPTLSSWESFSEGRAPVKGVPVKSLLRKDEQSHITASSNFSVRGIGFDMTKDEVISIMDGMVYRELDGTLVFTNSSVVGLNADFTVVFENKTISSIGYMLREKHTNDNLYIEDYNIIIDGLTEKYGPPDAKNTNWLNSLYKDKEEEYGFAISAGHLTMTSAWEKDDVNIVATIYGDNFSIDTVILYMNPHHKSNKTGTNTDGL